MKIQYSLTDGEQMCGVTTTQCDATCRGVGCVTAVSNGSLERLLALAPEHAPFCAGPARPGARGPPPPELLIESAASAPSAGSAASADGGVCEGHLLARAERTVGALTAIVRLLSARSEDLDRRAALVCLCEFCSRRMLVVLKQSVHCVQHSTVFK